MKRRCERLRRSTVLPLFVLLVFALVAAASLPLFAQTPADEQAPQALLSAAAAFDKAFRSGDTGTVAGYLADDCISTGAGGRVENKKQFLADYDPMAQQFASGGVTLDTFARSNVQVRAYGHVVVLTGALDVHSRISGVPPGDTQPVHYRFTQVWVEGASGWKLSVVQNGRISKETRNDPIP